MLLAPLQIILHSRLLMASYIRVVFVFLSFITVGLILGAQLQLAFLNRLEDTYGAGFRPPSSSEYTQPKTNLQMPGGASIWASDEDAEILRIGYVKPEVISWYPRIIILHNFLTTEECDYLRALALPRLDVSVVIDAKTGKGVASKVRTSKGMFLNPKEREYPIIQAIEKRISVYSQIPIENGELLQVLRYQKGQFYQPHNDYFSDAFNIKQGQRIATTLMYLSDDVEGGETYFPLAGSGNCSCSGNTVRGMSVKPVKGNAVLFWSMGLDGKSDPRSLHGACPVLSGEKWSATKWMRDARQIA